MKKQGLIKGAFILTIAGFIVKVLGSINTIIMVNIMGPEGIGLISMVLPIGGLMVTLTTLGLPVAISKLVAEAEGNSLRIKSILVISLFITTMVSIVLLTLAFLGIKFLSPVLLQDQRVYYSLIAILPLIPIVAVSSIFKGYFRGKQNMTPLAISLLAEQTIRILSVLILIKLLLPYGIEYAATGAIFGGVVGELFSLIYLLSKFKKLKKRREKASLFITQFKRNKGVFVDLLKTGMPVTGSDLIQSIVGVIQPIIITYSLNLTGISTSLATKQYGLIMGYAFPLLMLPSFIVNSLSIPLVPAISEAKEKNDYKLIQSRIREAMRIPLLVGAPFTILLIVLSEEFMILLFNSVEASMLVKIMAPFFFFHHFRVLLQAIIVGLGEAKFIMINNLFTSIITIIFIFILASQPNLGIYGVAISLNIGILLGTLINFLIVGKLVSLYINLTDCLKIIFLSITAGYGAFFTYHYLTNIITNTTLLTSISLIMSGIIYLSLLFIFKYRFTHR